MAQLFAALAVWGLVLAPALHALEHAAEAEHGHRHGPAPEQRPHGQGSLEHSQLAVEGAVDLTPAPLVAWTAVTGVGPSPARRSLQRVWSPAQPQGP